jgi:uncharacterized SAM-binding protein YcdF (DUF218 family)
MSRRGIKFWRYIFLTPVLGAVGLGVLWALALVSFTMTVLFMSPQDSTKKTQGIVVLTGGAERVQTALSLLQDGKADELLISGVYKTTRLQDILAETGIKNADRLCCISLGFSALDTVGNAAETATWVRDHHIQTLRLVTANYHMPRAAIEMRRVLPDVQIILHPVRTKIFKESPRAAAQLMLTEFHKTVVAAVRLFLHRVQQWGRVL